MSDQKWHQKATVQSAIVAGIPSLITAIIAIIAICLTYESAYRQFVLEKEQFVRDSTNSALQFKLVQKQIELSNKTFINDSITYSKQLLIANENLKIINNGNDIKETAYWARLRNTMWNLFDLLIINSKNHGYMALDALSNSDKLKLSDSILKILNTEIDNPVLIENKKCFRHWSDAISISKDLGNPELYQLIPFSRQITAMMNEIGFVWEKLVLKSKKLSSP